MAIKGSALLKAAGIGTVIYLLLQIASQLLARAYGFDTSPSQEEALAMLNSPFMAISLGLSCFSFLIDVGNGALYGFFAQRDGAPPNAGHYAIGGAVTNVVIMLIGSCIGLLFNGGIIAQSLQQIQSAPGLDPEAAGGVLAVSLVLGLCVGLALTAALGAGGGAIYGAIASSRAVKNPPPM
jgi:hypothetical protein